MKLETLHDFRKSFGSSEDQANLGKTHAISSRHALVAQKPRAFQQLLKTFELFVDARRGVPDFLVRVILGAKKYRTEQRAVARTAIMLAF